MVMYGVPQYGCQFHNGILEISSKNCICLIGCLCFLFVEIALEKMMSDHYDGQWSPRRPLARAVGSSKLCFQFIVISHLHSSKDYMALKAMLHYTYINYDR